MSKLIIDLTNTKENYRPELCEIDFILNKRLRNRNYEYLVKWKGHPINESRWVKANFLKSAYKKLKSFNKKNEKINRFIIKKPLILRHYGINSSEWLEKNNRLDNTNIDLTILEDKESEEIQVDNNYTEPQINYNFEISDDSDIELIDQNNIKDSKFFNKKSFGTFINKDKNLCKKKVEIFFSSENKFNEEPKKNKIIDFINDI